MPEFTFRRCSLWAALALMGACADTPGPDDIPPGADFAANILADGTKLFVYSTKLPGLRGGDPRNAPPPKRGQEGEQRPRRNLPRENLNGLQAMLAQNGYCRDGYVVLEQYERRLQYVIRGECRDAATAQDRERFPGGGR